MFVFVDPVRVPLTLLTDLLRSVGMEALLKLFAHSIGVCRVTGDLFLTAGQKYECGNNGDGDSIHINPQYVCGIVWFS